MFLLVQSGARMRWCRGNFAGPGHWTTDATCILAGHEAKSAMDPGEPTNRVVWMQAMSVTDPNHSSEMIRPTPDRGC